LDKPREADNEHDRQRGSFLGPRYDESDIKALLDSTQARFVKLDWSEVPGKIAELVNGQNVVGLFQGRAEFGPRALGGRSIIGDARSTDMQSVLNLKIKFRESFRPFAPSVLEEKASEFFELEHKSPYMLLVADVQKDKVETAASKAIARGLDKLKVKRSAIPAVTHVDNSARVQTVSKETNPLYYGIIKEFDKLTGCPVIINTSFNIRGEPIVGSVQDAYRCFMCTNMDYLLIENYLFEKAKQPNQDKYKKEDIVQELD
jgi:carbamoyltransferase